MIENCLRIKRIWSDENMIELSISANTAYTSLLNFCLYVTETDILDLKKAFSEFPNKPSDVFEWRVGSQKDNSAYFFRLKLFLYDRVGHAAIEIEADNKLSIPNKVISHFFITTEVCSINRFGQLFGQLLQEDWVEVEGITLIR